MKSCDGYGIDIIRYLDGELTESESTDLGSHLASCIACRSCLEEERVLAMTLRASGSLYSAPEDLKARVTLACNEAATSNAPVRRLPEKLSRLWSPSDFGWVPNWKALVAVSLIIIVFMLAVPYTVQQVRAAEYADTALTAHQQYLEGGLPLEIRSDSPQEVSAWFAGKVPFAFRLPDSLSYPGFKTAYRLEGGRLIEYRGVRAALVTYDSGGDRVSLLVAPQQSAVVAGGEEVRGGGLTFHYRFYSSAKVITWANRGVSYALVSNVAGSAKGSCLVCHQHMADRQSFEPSK